MRKKLVGLIYTGLIFFLIFFILSDFLTGSNLYSFQVPNFLEQFPINIPQVIIFFGVFYLIFFIFIKAPFRRGIESLRTQSLENSNDWGELNKKLANSDNIEQSKRKINKFLIEKKVKKINLLMDELESRGDEGAINGLKAAFISLGYSVDGILNPVNKYELEKLIQLEDSLLKLIPFPDHYIYYKENKLEKKASSLNSINDNNELKSKSLTIREDFLEERETLVKTPAIPFKGFDFLVSIFLAIFLPYILDYFNFVFSLVF